MIEKNMHPHSSTTGIDLLRALQGWRRGEGPLYRRLANAIRALAEAGALEHGAVLPSERALATSLAISRNTVIATYRHLRDLGWLDARRGSVPRVGLRTRDADALASEPRLSRLVGDRERPHVPLNLASPPAAPIVQLALEDPGHFLGTPAASGSGYSPLGDAGFAAAVAAHLRSRKIPAQPNEIVVTSGGQQAIWLALSSLGTAASIAVEAVTYPGALDAIHSMGGRLLALPMRPEGIDVARAVELIEATRPSALYLTTFQNPTGTVLTEDCAEHLVRVATACGTTIIDDRTLGDLALSGTPPRPLASVGSAARIITIGSLSKVFWGGLRLGWLHTNATLASQLRHRRAAVDLGAPTFLQRIGAVLLTRHFEATLELRLEQLRESLAGTRQAIAEAGLDWTYRVPAGGPNLWVQLPFGSAERFAARAATAGAPVSPPDVFEAVPGIAGQHFRLPFYLPPDHMQTGIRILAKQARRSHRAV